MSRRLQVTSQGPFRFSELARGRVRTLLGLLLAITPAILGIGRTAHADKYATFLWPSGFWDEPWWGVWDMNGNADTPEYPDGSEWVVTIPSSGLCKIGHDDPHIIVGSLTLAGSLGSYPTDNGPASLKVKDTATITNTGRLFFDWGSFVMEGAGFIDGWVVLGRDALMAIYGSSCTFAKDSRLESSGLVTFWHGTSELKGSIDSPSGTLNIYGGIVHFDADAFVGTVMLKSGEIGGSGTLAIAGPLFWSGGTISAKGDLYCDLLLQIYGPDDKVLKGRINTTNRAIWSGSTRIDAQSDAVINNTGIFEARGDAVFDGSPTMAPLFDNRGTFVKSSGTGSTTFSGTTFSNTGSVEVRSGTLALIGTVAQLAGSTLTGGSWDVWSNASLVFPAGAAITTNQGTVTLRGPGSSFQAINSLASNQASFAILEGRSFETAGALSNSGTMTVGAGSSLVVNGTFTNTGVLKMMGQISAAAGAAGAAPAPGLVVHGDLVNSGVLGLGGGVSIDGSLITQGNTSIGGPQAWTPGSQLIVDGGQLHLQSDGGSATSASLHLSVRNSGAVISSSPQHLLAMSLENGSFALAAGGANILRTWALSLAPGASLDVADNSLVVQATPQTAAEVLADITNWISSARNDGPTIWAGPGITTSSARTNPYLGLGVMLNGMGGGTPLQTFAGEPVGENTILARYTYNGDANLDGVVNADDYFLIDSNYIPQKPGWYNGDFNYDGLVNADDYFLIDSAFLGQTGPLASLAPPRNAAVPEPAVAALLAAALLTLRSRRASSPSP